MYANVSIWMPYSFYCTFKYNSLLEVNTVVKTYWLKNKDTTVAVIKQNTESNEFSMEVLDPDRLTYVTTKIILNDMLFREFIDYQVLTPQYQAGYAVRIKNLGLDPNDPGHRIKYFFLTRAQNVSHPIWLAYSESEKYGDWLEVYDLYED